MTKSFFSPSGRKADMSIDWEFLPSLAYLLGRKEPANDASPVWAETMPSGFDLTAQPSDPFSEPLPGLAIREVKEPEIFRLFFGDQTPPAQGS